MTARRWMAMSLLMFSSVVIASFGYGAVLLWRGPSRPSQGVTERPAALPPDVASLLERSGEEMKKGEVEQALLGYRRILTVGPSVEALLGLAEGEAKAGREAVAIAEYERVLRLDAENPTALLRVARDYAGRRETWDQAEVRYRSYLARVPGDADAWLSLARLLSWRGKGAAASEIYARDDVRPLLGPEDRRNHALALVSAGRDKEAEPALGSIARSNPGDVDVALSLGGVHASRGDWQQAIPLFRAALDRRPDDPSTNLAYGQGLLAVKQYRDAVGPLEKAVGAMPANSRAGLALARALRGAGDPRRAELQFERIMPSLDSDAGVEREYADLLAERKNPAKAAACYRRALELGLKDERLLAGLAGALNADQKPSEALPYLEEAYAMRQNARVGLDLARLYKRLGKNDRALQLLREIEPSPGPR